jgi:hypothetical protein
LEALAARIAPRFCHPASSVLTGGFESAGCTATAGMRKGVEMLYRDTEFSRQLAGERHAELGVERRTAGAVAGAPAEIDVAPPRTARRRLTRLRAQLRWPARVPARHPS